MSGNGTAARRSCSYGRAQVSTGRRPDTGIVQRNLQEEWERGCRRAGIALALTFGPLMGLGIWWGWAL